MFIVDLFAQHLDQRGIVYCHRLSGWGFDVDHQVVRVGVKRRYARREAVSLHLVDRPCCFFGVSEPRLVSQHLALLASGEKGKSFWTGRTGESKKAVAVNSGVAGEHLVQLFAAHTFHRITPKAFHCSDDGHKGSRSPPRLRSLAKKLAMAAAVEKIFQFCRGGIVPIRVNAVTALAIASATPMAMIDLKPDTKDSSIARRISCCVAGS